MKRIVCATVLLFLTACKAKISSDVSENSGQSGGFQAICDIANSSSAPIVCIDYPTASTQLEADCSMTEPGAYSAEGAVMGEWVSVGGSGVSTSCALTNTTSTVVASCNLSDRTIRYYANAWSLSSASADCTQHSGNFQP